MDKLIDLKSIKSIISSIVKENKMTDEEISECGAACGCGTTTADLGAEVQYLGNKKKKEGVLGGIAGGIIGNTIGSGYPIAGACIGSIAQDALDNDEKEKKEFLDVNATAGDISVLSAGNLLGSDKKESPEDIDSKMASFLNRIKEYLSSSDENLNTIEKVDKYQSVGLMLNDLLKEVGGLQELINLAKNGNTYAKEILEKFDLGETITTESALEEDDEVKEMARGILAPQEIAKREYANEYPESGIKTADQFLRKVINNPEAPGHDKYIQRFAYLIRNSDDHSFSNIAADVQLDNTEGSDDYALTKAYADALLGHRKSMSKSSYDSKGLINAYARNIVKRGPYYKPGRDMPVQQVSTGKMISNKYNEVDPKESNKVLTSFFKSSDWNSLNDNQKIKEINIIKDEADLDEIGLNIVSKEEHNVLDRLLGDE